MNNKIAKNEIYHFLNIHGQLTRAVNWQTESLFVVFRTDTSRVEFLENVDVLKSQNIDFELIKKIEKKHVESGAIYINQIGTLKVASFDDRLVEDAQVAAEDNKRFPIVIKYSAVSHAVAIVLLFATAWVLNKYFNATPEPKLIEVVAQARPKSEIAPVVDVSHHKIVKSAHKIVNKANKTKVVVKNKIFKSNNVNQNRNQKVVARPSKNLNNMGALAMFGGMKTGAVGASGMNLKSHTSSPGIGHNGGEAKSGGYERGLIGSGLVATGIGNSSSKMSGYGGLGTHGRGGGQPGYGDQNIGGGSGGAFYAPLSESDFSDTGLDVDQINSVIQRNMGQITYCYEQGLQATPGLSGRVQVKFVIAPSGRVSLAKIFDSSVSSRIVESCIVNKLKNWQFPKPVGSVSVRVSCPFSLKRLSQG